MTATPAPPSLDPFSVVVIFATTSGMTGDFPSIIAAYSVIVLSAAGGAYFSATGMPGLSKFGTLLHILMMMGLAIAATVPLAEIVSRLVGVEMRWLLSPLAILIGARPDWILRTARRWFARRTGLDDDIDKPHPKGPQP